MGNVSTCGAYCHVLLSAFWPEIWFLSLRVSCCQFGRVHWLLGRNHLRSNDMLVPKRMPWKGWSSLPWWLLDKRAVVLLLLSPECLPVAGMWQRIWRTSLLLLWTVIAFCRVIWRNTFKEILLMFASSTLSMTCASSTWHGGIWSRRQSAILLGTVGFALPICLGKGICSSKTFWSALLQSNISLLGPAWVWKMLKMRFPFQRQSQMTVCQMTVCQMSTCQMKGGFQQKGAGVARDVRNEDVFDRWFLTDRSACSRWQKMHHKCPTIRRCVHISLVSLELCDDDDDDGDDHDDDCLTYLPLRFLDQRGTHLSLTASQHYMYISIFHVPMSLTCAHSWKLFLCVILAVAGCQRELARIARWWCQMLRHGMLLWRLPYRSCWRTGFISS